MPFRDRSPKFENEHAFKLMVLPILSMLPQDQYIIQSEAGVSHGFYDLAAIRADQNQDNIKDTILELKNIIFYHIYRGEANAGGLINYTHINLKELEDIEHDQLPQLYIRTMKGINPVYTEISTLVEYAVAQLQHYIRSLRLKYVHLNPRSWVMINFGCCRVYKREVFLEIQEATSKPSLPSNKESPKNTNNNNNSEQNNNANKDGNKRPKENEVHDDSSKRQKEKTKRNEEQWLSCNEPNFNLY